MLLSQFHIAFPVHDLEAARSFYDDVLPGNTLEFKASADLEQLFAKEGYFAASVRRTPTLRASSPG